MDVNLFCHSDTRTQTDYVREKDAEDIRDQKPHEGGKEALFKVTRCYKMYCYGAAIMYLHRSTE
jgi:hypothetical protein